MYDTVQLPSAEISTDGIKNLEPPISELINPVAVETTGKVFQVKYETTEGDTKNSLIVAEDESDAQKHIEGLSNFKEWRITPQKMTGEVSVTSTLVRKGISSDDSGATEDE